MRLLRLVLSVSLAGLLVGCGPKEDDSASNNAKKTGAELQAAKKAGEEDPVAKPKTKPEVTPKPVVDPPVVDPPVVDPPVVDPPVVDPPLVDPPVVADRILDRKKAEKLEVRDSMIGFRNTLLFYTFKDQQAILTLSIGNTDETFPVKGKIHLFDGATTEEGLKKWINNQHSDGLFLDVPKPIFTGELPEGSCRVTSHKQTGTSENPTSNPTSPATFKNYEVKLTVKEHAIDRKAKLSAFTDTALVHVKPEAGEVTAGAKALEFDAESAGDVEIKQDGEWKPAKLPLTGLAEGKAVEVKVRGTLTHGIMAIGGETTGTIIRFGETTWELDLRNTPAFRPAAEKLNGKRVVVTGTVKTKAGVEIAKRTILTIESIDPADEGVPGPVETKTSGSRAINLKADEKKAEKLEVRHSMLGFRNTLLFYTFKDEKAILTLSIGNTDETFPVKGKIHLFDDATTEEGLKKWVNNQHSDGLFPDIPTPTFTGDLPEGTCRVTSHKETGTSENPSPVSPATFKNYEVKLSVKEHAIDKKVKLSAFTDTASVHVKSK